MVTMIKINKIELDGTNNTRDISYHNIKEKKLIRSDALNELSNADIIKLQNEYNLKVIIDLRTNEEIKLKDIDIPNVEYYHIPMLSEEQFGITHGNTLKEKLLSIEAKTPDMSLMYTDLVKRDKKDAWTKIFEILLNNDSGAILWHCQEGKDRCGLVSAIIEFCLGLNYNDIVEDYLYTNNSAQIKAKKRFDLMMEYTNNYETSERIKNLFLAKKEYLDSALNYINIEYGGINNFLEKICSLDQNKIKILKAKYLK